MAYCSKCGKPIELGAAFCSSCGAPVIREESRPQRSESYEGQIIKCPNCGEGLSSFVTRCPSCGYEIRGSRASKAMSDFAKELSRISDSSQRIVLIRSFPIPNTREDLFEFLIMASSNIDEAQSEQECQAWLAKCEQCSQKGRLLLQGDDLAKFAGLSESAKAALRKRRVKALFVRKSSKAFVKGALGALLSVALLLVGMFMDLSGDNSSLLQLVGTVALVAASLAAGKSGMAGAIVGACCGAAALFFGSVLDGAGSNGSMLQLCGVLSVAAAIVGLLEKNDPSETKVTDDVAE